MKLLLLFFMLGHLASAQILADFETNIYDAAAEEFKTFTAVLDHEQAPMTTANFMLLAGLEDEEWLGVKGDITPALHVPYSVFRPGNPYSKSGRLSLNVVYQQASAATPGDVDKYIVRQATTIFAILSTIPTNGVYQSLTGPNPVEIHRDNANNRFKIIINHDRTWLDSRFTSIRNGPFYQNIPITKVEPGLRFISGSFENNVSETPGYLFQDELVSRVIRTSTPWRSSFTENQGWTLAMDSPGANSNGSRFFITPAMTVANQETFISWNRRFTSFGTISTLNNGRNTVNEIMNLPIAEDGTPQANISIRKITFRRSGGTEVGFFPHQLIAELPGPISSLPLTIERTRIDQYFLTSTPTPSSVRTFMSTPDLISEPISFTSFTRPFDFEPTREDISVGVLNQPRYFFSSFSSKLPSWPSQEFEFAGSSIKFTRVTDRGIPSGAIILNFANNSASITGNYTVQMPSLTFDIGEGNTRSYPATVQQGTFTAVLNNEDSPFRARLVITNAEPAIDMTNIVMEFDFDWSRLLQDRFSRFTALNPNDSAYSFTGYWFNQN